MKYLYNYNFQHLTSQENEVVSGLWSRLFLAVHTNTVTIQEAQFKYHETLVERFGRKQAFEIYSNSLEFDTNMSQ